MAILWIFRHILRRSKKWLLSVIRSIPAWQRFWSSFNTYQKMAEASNALQAQPRYFNPRLGEDTVNTPIDATYFYQDAWAFEKIVQQRPERHVDVGSHHKYVALLSKVIPVTMVDIRPLPTPLNTLDFQKGSILELPFESGSLPSVSSLCVIEHIGLGRYGDPLDPQGTEKALAELKRVVMPGGDLYLSIPIDKENRIYFNAHRAFKEEYLLSLFPPFEVIEKRYIYADEFGDKLKSAFGTGCYHLRHQVS